MQVSQLNFHAENTQEFRESLSQAGTLEAQKKLTSAERQELVRLQNRDRHVRNHERLHLVTAGKHAKGGISYQYETGPDGKRYAVHGKVSVDSSTPNQNAEQSAETYARLKRAAVVNLDPSSADRFAAMMATRMESAAKHDQFLETVEEQRIRAREENLEKAIEAHNGDSRVLSPQAIVATFRQAVQPELVSNLFDDMA